MERFEGKIGKEPYLEAKKKFRRAVYKAKCEAEKNRFADVENRDDQKCEVFKIAKRMVKTNQDTIGEAWESYYEKLYLIGIEVVCHKYIQLVVQLF